MRAARALLLLIGTTLAALSPASANDGFSIVIPGRAGVPIIINGLDASWAVVESDWGLAKNLGEARETARVRVSEMVRFMSGSS